MRSLIIPKQHSVAEEANVLGTFVCLHIGRSERIRALLRLLYNSEIFLLHSPNGVPESTKCKDCWNHTNLAVTARNVDGNSVSKAMQAGKCIK